MFNRFSKDARRVLESAIAEAERHGDPRVGTDHLLLALLRDSASLPAKALGIDLQTARGAVDALDRDAMAAIGLDTTGLRPPPPPCRSPGQLPFTGGAKWALQRTVRESILTDSRQLESRHLLLGLLSCQRPDPAAELLAWLGLDASVVRRRLQDLGAVA